MVQKSTSAFYDGCSASSRIFLKDKHVVLKTRQFIDIVSVPPAGLRNGLCCRLTCNGLVSYPEGVIDFHSLETGDKHWSNQLQVCSYRSEKKFGWMTQELYILFTAHKIIALYLDRSAEKIVNIVSKNANVTLILSSQMYRYLMLYFNFVQFNVISKLQDLYSFNCLNAFYTHISDPGDTNLHQSTSQK